MMEALVALAAGLLIGSFLNVCIYRLPRDLSVMRPARSFCPDCERTIAWYDNIPVLSWLLLRGRCRWCGAEYGVRYLLVEILCGAMFFMVAYRFGLSALAVKLMTFSALQLGLFFSDLEERILPDEFTKGGVVLGLLFAWFVPLPWGFTLLVLPPETAPEMVSLAESAFAAVLGYLGLRLLGWLYARLRDREGLGMGDVKMVAMMGAFLGLMPALQAVMIGSLLGSVLGLLFIRLRGKNSADYELPFGSFLAVGAVAAAWVEALRT